MTSNWIVDIEQELRFGAGEEIIGYAYVIHTSPDEYEKYVHVNTLPVNEINSQEDASFVFYRNTYGNILSISVYDKCVMAFTIRIDVWAVLMDGEQRIQKYIGMFEKTYNPSVLETYAAGMERANKMINSNVSFQLLRTNPKLTGNVKVVVTEDSKLYLDTFKVSLALGQYKYRRVPVNANEYYGRSLMHFRKMSTDDFYKVEDNCFNMFTAVNDFKAQYYTVYNSGVRTNEDHLYSENFAMLAPLCVKNVLPDFFLVFKVNTDEISKRKSMSESEKIKYFFKNGKLVKSFDFRDGTNLGKYIRNIRDNAKNYPGDVFASYDIKNYNKFIGISVDRGVVTSAYESMYKERTVNNQVAFNEYFTEGFERNKLVSKDILNFEFMFNDEEENLFSINTYFGIYVTLNGETDTFSCIGYDGCYEFDNKDLHNIPSGSDILRTEHEELIYGISTPDRFIRLKDSIYDASVMEEFKLKPYRSIVTGKYHDMSESSDYEFVTVTINKDIKEGEHFRVIDLKNAVIYDVVATGYTKYLENNTSEVCNNYIWYRRMRFTVKTISAYFSGSLENQISTLAFAFNKLKISKTAVKTSRNALSIKTYNSDCIFEKVSSVSDYTLKNKDILLDYNEDDGSITFFGSISPKKLIVEASDVYSPENDYFYLYPYYTDATGYRIAYAGKFQKVTAERFINAIVSNDISKIDEKTVVYIKEDGTPVLYEGFDIVQYEYDGEIKERPETVRYILSPDLESYIIDVTNPYIYNGTISLYSVYPINSGVCSILPYKDFMFDVIDKDTVSNYIDSTTEIKAISDGGEFLKTYMINDIPVQSKTEEYLTDYFDKTRKSDTYLYRISETTGIPIYNKLESETDKDTYYSYLLKINHTNSDISLTSPYVCKWRSNGTDARGENMRMMYSYDASYMDVGRSYYVPYDKSDIQYNEKTKYARLDTNECYNEELGYLGVDQPDTKFIKYLKNIFNGILPESVNESGISVKDAIMSGRISIDDLLYYGSTTRNKFSTVYKAGENTIEFISGGIKFKIRSSNSDVINFNAYTGYQAVFISVPGFVSEHNTACELIIDEVNAQLALIYYTGTNSVENKSVKKSSVFKVKHTSPLSECICTNTEDGDPIIKVLNDTSISSELCNNNGYLLLTNRHIYDNTGYSNRDDALIIASVVPYLGFYRDSYIIAANPYIMVNGAMERATNSLINMYTDLYNDGIDMYIISDSPEYDINEPATKETLRNALTSCGIYVRKHEGIKDYTNLESFLDFTVVPPYRVEKEEIIKTVGEDLIISDKGKKTFGYVQTTYGMPVMTDILNFNYSDSELNSVFDRVLDGMNIEISKVEPLKQLWINKYTTSSNYCIPIDSSYPRISVDCLTNVSIMDNCWGDMYYDYDVHDFLGNDDYDRIEWSTPVPGYQTGYEKNCFFGSRGINMNGIEGKSIDLTVWKNTKVSEKDKCIKLNISESLIYKILFTKGFSDSWKYLGLRSNTFKIKYIKNTILPMLNITSKTVFTLYQFDETKKLMFKDLINMDGLTEVSNVKNELKYENGKYYMYVYPDEMHTYYAKMHIEL